MFSIGKKLIFMTSGIVLLVASGLTFSTSRFSTSLLGEMSEQQLKSATEQSFSTLEAFWDVRLTNLKTWANHVVVTGLVREPAMASILEPSLRSAFESLPQREPWLKQMFIYHEDDILFSFNEDLEIQENFYQEKFNPKESFQIYSGEDIFKEGKGFYIILSSSVAEETEDEELKKASIHFVINIDEIQKFLFSQAKVGMHGFVSLIHSYQGQWISPTFQEGTQEQKQFLTYQKNLREISSTLKTFEDIMIQGKINESSLRGVTSIAALRDIKAPVQLLIKNSIYIALGALLGGFILAAFLAKRISNPIALLTEQVNKLAQGNWNVSLKIETNDEIESLSEDFTRMAFELQKSQNSLKERISDVEFLQNLTNQLVNISSFGELQRFLMDKLEEVLKTKLFFIKLSSESSLENFNKEMEEKKFQYEFMRPLLRPKNKEIYGFIAISQEISLDLRLTQLIEAMSQGCELSIENIASLNEGKRQAALEVEMKMAQAVQESLFPKTLPDVPGYEVATFFAPATDLGGTGLESIMMKIKKPCVFTLVM